MALNSAIEWTQSTWNPVTGCTKVSAGCLNCYAERMARRLQAMGQPNYARGFDVALHQEVLDMPLKWRKPQMIFVNSMSDVFNEEVPEEFIFRIFEVMNQASWHCFQILTKRSARLLQMNPLLPWAPHVWMGVTVENQKCTIRADHLRKTSAAIKFLSMEPLLGPVHDLDLTDLDWVIVGGESGPGARPMLRNWVTDIRDRCRQVGVPFFFKQWGGFRKKEAGRHLDGRLWNEMPKMIAPHKAGPKHELSFA